MNEKKTATNGTNNGTNTIGEQIEAVLAQIDVAKAKVREGMSLLTDTAATVKLIARENKAQAADLDKARTTLTKLQAMSL